MLTLLTFLLAAFPTPSIADSTQTLSGVTMPGTVTVKGTELVLNGMALRKKMVFKVYVAGLYLPARNSDADAILGADTPRQIVLHFLRGVDKGKMCGAWDESLKNNSPDASADVKEKFATLCKYMDDVDKDQLMVFTYLPEQGTTIEVNGAAKGTLEGKEFADALFRSWLGPKPGPGDDFKKKLLGKKD
jgi:chalcone isomerase-like protein